MKLYVFTLKDKTLMINLDAIQYVQVSDYVLVQLDNGQVTLTKDRFVIPSHYDDFIDYLTVRGE